MATFTPKKCLFHDTFTEIQILGLILNVFPKADGVLLPSQDCLDGLLYILSASITVFPGKMTFF